MNLKIAKDSIKFLNKFLPNSYGPFKLRGSRVE